MLLREFIYSIIIYAGLVLLMRLMGKRQLGELELSELIVTILISEIAAKPIVEEDSTLLSAFIPAATLMGLEYLLSVAALKNVRLRGILSGKPALLVVRGRIDQTQMRKNRITPNELAEAMRDDGITDLRSVQYAVLETSGKVNIIPTPQASPVTAGQMGVDEPDPGWSFIIISDGHVMSDNLRLLGRDENWLMKQLKANGLSSPKEVYMMTADSLDGIYLSPMED